MKSEIPPDDNLAVGSSSSESLNGDDSGKKDTAVTKVGLTIDKATEIALGTIDQDFTIGSGNSPYPEIRANVPNTDDVELPVNTVRMWFLGIFFTMASQRRSVTFGLVANWYAAWILNKSVFSIRYLSVTIT